MEEAVTNVLRKLDHTDEKLGNIETKIEKDIDQVLTNANALSVEDKISLLKKLDEVKQDYAAIKNEAVELSCFQKEMALAFQQQLQETVMKLQALTRKEAGSINSSDTTSCAIKSLVEHSNVAETLKDKLKVIP